MIRLKQAENGSTNARKIERERERERERWREKERERERDYVFDSQKAIQKKKLSFLGIAK